MTGSAFKGRRIAVIGNSGSGKSTLARALSARLGIPHIELDALNWQANWVGLSTHQPEQWRAVVAEAITGDAWVSDGNYTKGGLSQILPRASDLIWLDYSRAVIMARVIRRSIRRVAFNQELWPGTGNRESVGRWLRPDHPIRWTWDTYRSANQAREALLADPAHVAVRKHRFKTPSEARRWLDRLNPNDGA